MSETMKSFVSPEYRSKCIEWALRTEIEPAKVIEAAKKYYAYVYEDAP